jgi:hypothetical protein
VRGEPQRTQPLRVVTQGHHGLPKFLGGDAQQILSKLDPKIHSELHSILRQNLREAGIPLNVLAGVVAALRIGRVT